MRFTYILFASSLPIVLARKTAHITVTETIKEDPRTVLVPVLPNTVTITSCTTVTVTEADPAAEPITTITSFVPSTPQNVTVNVTVTAVARPALFQRPSLVARSSTSLNFMFGLYGAMKTCLPAAAGAVPAGWARAQCTFYVVNAVLSMVINIIGAKDHHEFWKKRQQQWREYDKQVQKIIGDDDDDDEYDEDCDLNGENDDGDGFMSNNKADADFKVIRLVMDTLGVQVSPFKNQTTLQECAYYKFTKEGYRHIMGPELREGIICLSQKGLNTFERLRPDGSRIPTPYEKAMQELKVPAYLRRFDKYMNRIKGKKTLTTWQMLNFHEYTRDVMEQLSYLTDEITQDTTTNGRQYHMVIRDKDNSASEPLLSMNIF